MKFPGGHCGHFAPAAFPQNQYKSRVFDKSVDCQFFKISGLTNNAHLVVVFSEAHSVWGAPCFEIAHCRRFFQLGWWCGHLVVVIFFERGIVSQSDLLCRRLYIHGHRFQ